MKTIMKVKDALPQVLGILCILLGCGYLIYQLSTVPPAPRLEEERSEDQGLGATPMTDDQGLQNEYQTDTATRTPLRGSSTGSGFRINWQGLDAPEGADILTVLKACENRLKYLQNTKLGSVEHAQALFSVSKAIDSLEGTSEVSTPIPEQGIQE